MYKISKRFGTEGNAERRTSQIQEGGVVDICLHFGFV